MAGKKILTVSVMLFVMAMLYGFGCSTVYALESSTTEIKTEIYMEIDTTELQAGISAIISVSIVNAEGAELKEIAGMGDNDFTLWSSMQLASFRSSDFTQSDMTYVIMPNKEGTYKLQAVYEYNGETYRSNEIEVSVSEITDISDIEEGKKFQFLPEVNITEDEVYVGQKTVINYYLYTNFRLFSNGNLNMRLNVDGIGITEKPDFMMSQEDLVLNNNPCAKYLVYQNYLSPYKTGEFVIPSNFLNIRAAKKETFNNIKDYSFEIDPMKLTVKPLPEEGRPADFNGIVGSLNIDAKYNKQIVNNNETVTLDVLLHGNCNLDAIENVIKDSIPGFTVNQTLVNRTEGYKEGEYYAEKEFRIILIPEKTGDIEIAPIGISYFDTEQQIYTKAEIPGTTITVEGAMPQLSTQGGQDSGGKVIKISQINYGKFLSGGIITIRFSVKLLYTVLIIIALLVLAAVGLIIIMRRRKRDKGLEALYKQLMKAEELNELYNCFNSMIKYCFGINLKAASRDSLEERLCGIGTIKPELSDKILNAMEDMERKTVGIQDIKNNIKLIYKALRNRHNPDEHYNLNKA